MRDNYVRNFVRNNKKEKPAKSNKDIRQKRWAMQFKPSRISSRVSWLQVPCLLTTNPVYTFKYSKLEKKFLNVGGFFVILLNFMSRPNFHFKPYHYEYIGDI